MAKSSISSGLRGALKLHVRAAYLAWIVEQDSVAFCTWTCVARWAVWLDIGAAIDIDTVAGTVAVRKIANPALVIILKIKGNFSPAYCRITISTLTATVLQYRSKITAFGESLGRSGSLGRGSNTVGIPKLLRTAVLLPSPEANCPAVAGLISCKPSRSRSP